MSETFSLLTLCKDECNQAWVHHQPSLADPSIAWVYISPGKGARSPETRETAQVYNNKMASNLLKAHELITNIQHNFSNEKKLRENCGELEDLIEYLEDNSQYHYLLFLVEVYAAKLRDYQAAELLCKKVIKDGRPAVELQGLLRLNFINALQHKYSQAINNLEQAHALSSKKLEAQIEKAQALSKNKLDPQSEQTHTLIKSKLALQTIFLDYFQRMFMHSGQSNLLNAVKYSELQRYDEAIQYYNLEFESQNILDPQVENKYFASKSILQLLSIFPAGTFKGIDRKKYEAYLQDLEEEKDQKGDSNFIYRVDQNYQDQKNYIKKVVELVFLKEQSIRKSKMASKNNQTKFSSQFQMKRILAILKLRKVLKNETKLNPAIRAEFVNCLSKLEHNSMKDYSMINQFTQEQFKIANKATEILRRWLQKPVFDHIRTRFMTKKPLRKPTLFQNLTINEGQSPTRFTRHPLEQSIQFKIKQIKSEELSQGEISSFTGSYMEKINENSSGHEKRYFYFLRSEVQKGKFKLYYNEKQSKISNDDYYYDLKSYQGIVQGKTTKPFKRSECDKFDERQCFSILLQDKKTRNFYVPEKKDYQSWMRVFKMYENIRKGEKVDPSPLKGQQSKMNLSSMRKTVLMD